MQIQMSPIYNTSTNGIRYKRIIGGRPCTGFRLNLRRLSIRRLRARFIRFFGFLKKRLFSRIIASSSSSSSSSSFSPRKGTGELNKATRRCQVSSLSDYSRMKSLGRTNSFYTEAIADCLEFIKRSSGASSLDMSVEDHAPDCALNSSN